MNTATLDEQQVEREIVSANTHQAPKANILGRVVVVVGALLLVLVLAAAAGLGIWTHQLNTALNATQKSLSSLQEDYDQLKADNAKLTTDLNQANSTLQQTKSDLDNTKAEMQAANHDVATQRAHMDTAKRLAAIMEAMLANDESPAGVQAKIYNSGDAQLISLWDEYLRRPSTANLLAFYRYLFGAISTALR